MQQDYTIAREGDAMFGSGILNVYFDAFSSKNRHGTTPANIYEQFCYADFIYFTFTGKERDKETGYGTSGTETGRPIRITDGSGSYECHYDALGNVTDETRTIALPQHSDVYQFRMRYQYDSWGRMLSMTYPDGEEITYTYQWGGDLHSMHGVKNSNHRTYIREIRYNPFGQRERVNYGNGTQAQYHYDILHRLAHLRSYDSLGNLMQKLDYTFDNASNITFIKNSAGVANSLGGGYENNYHYDNLHRLTHSDGGGVAGNYDMDMAYTPSGRIIWKYRNAQSSSVSETAEMFYGYCDDHQPHAVRRIFNYKNGMLYDLRWDEAGNLGQVSMSKPGEMFDAGRFLFWTEDNRMHAAVDDRYHSYYAYDHSGERRLKLTGDNKLLDVNADFMVTYTVLNEPTLYPSAYMVLTNKGYTKHYYAGTERVAARIGGGCLKTLETSPKLQKAADLLFKQSLDQTYERMLKNNDPDCIQNPVEAPPPLHAWIDGIPDRMKARVNVDNSTFRRMIRRMTGDCEEEPDVYFYHSDHLGSASWITDGDGMPVQHLQYLPYGEPYINQRVSGYNERFTFTGKERDAETGYGYFGARYLDHELMTMWLSVDPMADKYPSISPYAYCAWNPVRLVDPDGRDVWEINGEGKIVNHIKDKNRDAFYLVDKNGNRKSSISFQYGTITDYKKAGLFRNSTSFSVNDESSGAELFKFFADNIKIEFGLINTENDGSTVMTNHQKSRVSATMYARELSDKGQTITSVVHNHPNNTNPSGFEEGERKGDRAAARSFPKSHGRTVDFYVYIPKNGKLIQYDETMILGGRSWASVFKPSAVRVNPIVKPYPGIGLPSH